MNRPIIRDIEQIKDDIKEQERKVKSFQKDIDKLVRKGDYSTKAQLEHAQFNLVKRYLKEYETELEWTEYVLSLESQIKGQ